MILLVFPLFKLLTDIIDSKHMYPASHSQHMFNTETGKMLTTAVFIHSSGVKKYNTLNWEFDRGWQH